MELPGWGGGSVLSTREARSPPSTPPGGELQRHRTRLKQQDITWPPQDTQTRSRPIMGKDGPSDSALAAARGWRLRRTAADRHAARCASRALCSGGAPRRYSPSKVRGKVAAMKLFIPTKSAVDLFSLECVF